MQQSYTPSDKILEKYANLLVNFGTRTRDLKKLPKGSVIRFVCSEAAKPLYYHLQNEILRSGYHPMGVLTPTNTDKYKFDSAFYEFASNKQLKFSPDSFNEGLIKEVSGQIFVLAETEPLSLNDVDPKKIITRNEAKRKLKKGLYAKADEGKLGWTIGLYGTDASAEEAGVSTKQYWNQIIKACRLDKDDPVAEWLKIVKQVRKTADKLTKLNIDNINISGEDLDINIGIGANRKWVGGTSNNIPSFEVFTSPDYRRINGWVKFNQPHYRYGSKIEGIELRFEDGKVIAFKAAKNQDLLASMLKSKGGNFVGEVSLTDARLSNITKYMAEILYDENTGGKYGNTHIALGSSFHECFEGSLDDKTEKDWEELGFNDSAIHSDLISTTNRTVTATLQDGTKQVIYENGQFTV